MTFLESILIAIGIFIVLYTAYLIGTKKLGKYKIYPILLNCVSIVICVVLIFDAINRGREAFILFLLLLLGLSVKKLLDETKRQGVS